MMMNGKITTQGMGMNVEQTVGMFGGASNSSVGASFAQQINCMPKFDPTQNKPKVWQTEAGVYGLPSKVSVKMAPTTLGKELVEALQVFGNEACGKAAEGLAGQSETQFPGLRGLMQQAIVWTIELEKISFEGDELPMEVCVSDVLKDGEEFQASGKLNQVRVGGACETQDMVLAFTGVQERAFAFFLCQLKRGGKERGRAMQTTPVISSHLPECRCLIKQLGNAGF
jgi:hypothetical protein